MCGIAGILQCKQGTIDPRLIESVTDSMAHRGPDAAGYFSEEEISLGHRRLSIIDVSEVSNQPFYEASGRYVMVFNGEIYNYQQVKALLPEYPFKTSSDTEVVIAAYAKWGMDCIQHFKGMFAIAIWDRQQKQLTLIRDRFGVKPLYYYFNGEYLIFASEVRAIVNSGLVNKKINPQGLYEYFSYQSIGAPYSLIEGIEQLEGGHFLTLQQGKINIQQYWSVFDNKCDFDWNNVSAVHQQIKQLLTQSVERRLVSDVPIGAFLSGGIDSSVIVGLMASVSKEKPKTFNIYFDEPEYDESAYADLIAKKFETSHTKIHLRPLDFLDDLQPALAAMDTPSGDGINTYIVSKAIRKAGITVALSGLGGDELFAGYPIFKQFLSLQSKRRLWKMAKPVRLAAASLVSATDTRKERIRTMLNQDDCSIENVYPVSRQIISKGQISHLTTLKVGSTALERSLTSAKDQLHHFPLLSQVSIAELMGYTQHTLLKDTDQMSMANALEVREPFFDHELVNFILSIPDTLKKPIYPKSLLVESVKPLLPDEVVFRKKKGFTFPWHTWMKNELKTFCEQKIQNIAQRDFINGKALLAFWQQFLKGDRSVRWAEVWLFVVLEDWLEKNGI
jgi:asparagine synthase (glutamine-hydrolysing)